MIKVLKDCSCRIVVIIAFFFLFFFSFFPSFYLKIQLQMKYLLECFMHLIHLNSIKHRMFILNVFFQEFGNEWRFSVVSPISNFHLMLMLIFANYCLLTIHFKLIQSMQSGINLTFSPFSVSFEMNLEIT